ncbi:MAG: hypothetical protein WAZ60_23840 [Desulfosalsimonadaceae bacterium]
MTTRTCWAIVSTLLLVSYMAFALWFWNEISRPYERPAGLTPMESMEIERAKKKHGREIRVRVETGRIYFVRDGQEILIARRTP